MKHTLLENYKLYKKLRKLESLVYEKTAWRGEPSKAYQIWKYLMDNGPSSVDSVRREFPPKISSNVAIQSFIDGDLIYKSGNTLSANPNYSWEDVGVIPRTAAQELANQINDSSMETVDDDEVAPAQVPARRTRQPRTTRTREIKPNLFSRKFDEVKAAIDAGADVNERNDAGKTPLQFACSDKNGNSYDIIKLLIDHGALPWLFWGRKPNIYALLDGGDTRSILEFVNAITRNNYPGTSDLDDLILGNASYKNKYPLYYAIEECGITDTNVLTALTCEGWYDKYSSRCINDVCYNFYRTDKISASAWEAIATKATRGDIEIQHLYGYVNEYVIVTEIKKGGPTPVLDAFISRGYMPPVVSKYSLANLNRAVLERYYDLLVDTANGKLKTRLYRGEFFDYCVYLSNTLNRSSDFVFNFITDEWITTASHQDLDEVIMQLVHGKRADILIRIARLKPKSLDQKFSFFSIVCDITDMSETGNDVKVTSAICRILNNINVNPDVRLSSWQIDDIRRSNNKYLIEYLFERGLADTFMFGISDVENSPHLSRVVKSVAKEFGYNKVWDETSLRERNNRKEYLGILESIIERIKTDDWNSSCQRWIQSHPEALREKDLVEAVNNNLENSITARQVKRMIDRLPPSNEKDDVYDF